MAEIGSALSIERKGRSMNKEKKKKKIQVQIWEKQIQIKRC